MPRGGWLSWLLHGTPAGHQWTDSVDLRTMSSSPIPDHNLIAAISQTFGSLTVEDSRELLGPCACLSVVTVLEIKTEMC